MIIIFILISSIHGKHKSDFSQTVLSKERLSPGLHSRWINLYDPSWSFDTDIVPIILNLIIFPLLFYIRILTKLVDRKIEMKVFLVLIYILYRHTFLNLFPNFGNNRFKVIFIFKLQFLMMASALIRSSSF